MVRVAEALKMVYEQVLSLTRCPDCLGVLSLKDAGRSGEQILSGTLACVCGKTYPIVDGIPVLA